MSYTWSTFKDAVKTLMTDQQRNDLNAAMTVSEFIKAKIAQHVDKNPVLAKGYMDSWTTNRNRLVGYTVQTTTDLFRAKVNAFLTVDAKRVGIQEFIDAQIEVALADFAGLASFIDSQIRQAVIEMQEYIPFYRGNHETRYTVDDVQEEGEASRGLLPEEARLWDAYYVKDDEPCVRMPVAQYDWQNRCDLTCGSPRVTGHDFLMALEPTARTFLLFPPVLEDHYLSVFWDGTKITFADYDSVPFDEEFAEAIANYVLAKIYVRPESLNGKLATTHLELYKSQRRQLFRACKERTIIRFLNDSPSPQRGGCGTDCAVTDTTGSFGDGTIPPVPIPYS